VPDGIFYASDVRVSLPQAVDPDAQLSVPMFGLVFTENGLFHDLDAERHEELSRPTFAPEQPAAATIWGNDYIDWREDD
jgi:hypothetical protein